MPKLLLLDKDGTLVKPASGETFVQSPQDQELIPGVADTIAKYQGWMPVIVSNQGGVEAGHKTLNDAVLEMRYCLKLLDLAFGYFCPNFKGQGHEVFRVARTGLPGKPSPLCPVQSGFRKPNPGMLLLAMHEWKPYRENWEDVLMVGDREEDRLAAQAAGIAFMDAETWRNQR